MKDAFGTELNVGDIVAFREAHGRSAASLEPCEVVGFTPKMARLRRLRVRTLEHHAGYDLAFVAYPDLCVRIDVKAYLGVSS